MDKPYRILLADDHSLFREGIKIALSSNPDIEVVGEASNGFEAIFFARKIMPDIILMDIAMPKCNGLEATATISRDMPQIKIIILTVSDDSQDLYEAIQAGAQGYLLKDLQPKKLFEAIEMIAEGEVLLAGGVANKILDGFRLHSSQKVSDPEFTEPLTRRESEILQLVAKGLSNSEIADHLVISTNTVKNHLSNILSKLHMHNRIKLTAFAIRKGLVKKSN